MSLGEFDLIAKYFDRPARRAALGIGDDCALLAVPPGMQLATSCDMLVEGRHFLSTVAPGRLGHKALAVNLSDLAACGAEPLAFTLALALPSADEVFLDDFSRGLLALADAHSCELIGGDTTRGPRTLDELEILPGVPDACRLLRGAGWELVVLSNQIRIGISQCSSHAFGMFNVNAKNNCFGEAVISF
jgi:thiamine-monophosphate kinase